MSSITMADALFTKTQQRVLGLLYGKPDESFYTNEIVRWADMGRGTIRRELDRLVSAGLLLRTKEGNQHHYQANPDCPIYRELRGIVMKTISMPKEAKPVVDRRESHRLKIAGQIEISRSALHALVKRFHIRRLFLFGSAARGELGPDSDIDLLVEFEDKRAPSMGGMVEIQDAFTTLFHGRQVDIATPSILNNPFRKRAIEKDMEELYAA